MAAKPVDFFILDWLINFNKSQSCCLDFCELLEEDNLAFFRDCCGHLGLGVTRSVLNGIESNKVYKKNCCHSIKEQIKYDLTASMRKNLFLIIYNQFIKDRLSENQMNPELFLGKTWYPKTTIQRFSFNTGAPNAPATNMASDNLGIRCALDPHKLGIIQCLSKDRIILLSAALRQDTSVAVPFCIYENSVKQNKRCKMFVIENENSSAASNSEALATLMGSSLGDTVAFQMQAQNKISLSSQIVYTTASFFLRVLMNQKNETFHQVSHIVVSNVHLHEPLTDILLCEIRLALNKFPEMQIILLSNSSPHNEFINYFGQGHILGVKEFCDIKTVYLDELPVETTNMDNLDPRRFPYNIVYKLLEQIYYNPKCEKGNTIIFFPNMECLLRAMFSITKYKSLGNPSHDFMVKKIWDNSSSNEWEDAIKSTIQHRTVILTTNSAESLVRFKSVKYIIDCAYVERFVYNLETRCREKTIVLLGKEELETRSSLLLAKGTCFRLIKRATYKLCKDTQADVLSSTPIDRICLTVKLLSPPRKRIVEYLKDVIVCPYLDSVEQHIQQLKDDGILDAKGNVTWLGTKSIDLPIPCFYARMFETAILLRCLDPILTIVSVLNTSDFINYLKKKKYHTVKDYETECGSDHLFYLRVYQEWQNKLHSTKNLRSLTNEDEFILQQYMEQVFDVRTSIVALLRLSHLVHSQGPFAMTNINSKSNSWPLIKASLIRGRASNLCVMETNKSELKGNQPKKLSVEHGSLAQQYLQTLSQPNRSSWILFENEHTGEETHSISCCTVISPITVLLFGSSGKQHPWNIINDDLNNEIALKDVFGCKLDSKDAQLIFKFQNWFANLGYVYLKWCSMNSFRQKLSETMPEIELINLLERVLTEDDELCNLNQPEEIGLRPKAMPRVQKIEN